MVALTTVVCFTAQQPLQEKSALAVTLDNGSTVSLTADRFVIAAGGAAKYPRSQDLTKWAL